jgi:hypothetical protein
MHMKRVGHDSRTIEMGLVANVFLGWRILNVSNISDEAGLKHHISVCHGKVRDIQKLQA